MRAAWSSGGQGFANPAWWFPHRLGPDSTASMFSRVFIASRPYILGQRTVTREQEIGSSQLRFVLWPERLDLARAHNIGQLDPKGKNGQISGIHTKKFVSGHHA